MDINRIDLVFRRPEQNKLFLTSTIAAFDGFFSARDDYRFC